MSGLTSALNIAKTGLHLQETNIAVKSQNLAAQGVDAYKRQYTVAQDLGYQDIAQPGSSTSGSTISAIGLPIGSGVKIAGIYRSFAQGDQIQTENPLDVMIEGNGFYQIQMPDGTTGYTRAGVFEPNAQGQLVSIDGYPILPTITIPNNAESIQISQEGVVEVIIQGQPTPQNVGQMQLATFINPNGLKAMGKNAFVETTASGTPTVSNPAINGVGSLLQGVREASNVNPVEEITDLIKIQHAYEHLTKVVSTGDSMYDAANRMTR